MAKGLTSVISAVMIMLGVMIMAGLAYAWFNGTLARMFDGGLYAQAGDVCIKTCIIDPDKIYRVLVPLDAETVVKAKLINNGAGSKSYALVYYPDFTPEISMVASLPVVTVPAGESRLEEVTLRGLIAKNNEIVLNITMVNTADKTDTISFGVRSIVNTNSVPETGLAWMFVILLASAVSVYMKAR